MKRQTRRWGRILFNTFTAISLLLAIATAGLWVRGYFCADHLSYQASGGYRLRVHSANGGISLERQSNIVTYGEFHPPTGFAYEQRTPPDPKRKMTYLTPTQWRFAGFEWVAQNGTVGPTANSVRPGAYENRFLRIPNWAVLALLTIPIGLWAWSTSRARRKDRLHLCPACGYDTRANPAKCSECGHEILSAKH